MKNRIKAIDKRIQKTKKYLSDALISLILEKGYEAVTIQDIIDKANVGRSTFYSHYENKEQLLFSGNQHLSETLFHSINDKSNEQIDFLTIYIHAENNFQIAKAMLGEKSGNLIIDHVSDVFSLKIKKELNQNILNSKAGHMENHFVSEALGAALVSYLKNWVDADMPFSPKEMADKSNELIEKFTDLTASKQ